MATYTSNYGWTKPSGSDNVDISVLNDNLDDQDSTIHDAFLNMAPPFSESSTYAVNDIVLYDTGLYKCHTAVVTPGSWTGSTNWQVYKLSEGGSGGGGTSNYNDLTNKPSINGVTLSGNKTTSDLGIDKTAVGLSNVPNVSTNDQTPTFTEAGTRNNIASGEKLSVIFGKIQKFFNDLKTVAFTGNASDLNYDNTASGLTATDVQGAVDELAESYPADKVMMSDGVTSVEDALDAVMPRTASGTTLAQLNDAVAQLTNNQRKLSSIWVNNTLLLRYSYENRYQNISVTTTNGKIQDYRITLGNNPSYIAVESDGSTVSQNSLTVTSWTLYYQGTPIL
jgi:hypothetical protein